MKRCRSASTSDEKAKHYIDILLSSVEYETFVKLMKIMRPVAEMRASVAKSIASPKAEGKGGAPASVQSPAKASKEVDVEYGDQDQRVQRRGGRCQVAGAAGRQVQQQVNMCAQCVRGL
jgi:hypothetical protein